MSKRLFFFMSDSSSLKAKAWGLFAFLAFALPFGIFGIWGSFEKDKTIPQWLAERGWPSVKEIAGPYLIFAALVSLLVYLLLAALSRRPDRPKLTGKIICLDADCRFDMRDNDYDCFLTLWVELVNGATTTAVSTFSLEMGWENERHPGTSEPLHGYYVQTLGRDPGDEQSKHAIRTEALIEFPYGEEITSTNYKRGWARFSFGSLPTSMVNNGGHLVKEVDIKLTALDSKRDPHLIYEGTTTDLGGCGKIQRHEWKIMY
jgi:hypothetical protein